MGCAGIVAKDWRVHSICIQILKINIRTRAKSAEVIIGHVRTHP